MLTRGGNLSLALQKFCWGKGFSDEILKIKGDIKEEMNISMVAQWPLNSIHTYLEGMGYPPALLNEELCRFWFSIFVIIHFMLTQTCKSDPSSKNIKEWELLVAHTCNTEESSMWPWLAPPPCPPLVRELLHGCLADQGKPRWDQWL